MKQRVSSVFVSLLCISLSVIFSLRFFAVDAAGQEIIASSPSDIRAFYGDSISFSYFFNGVEYSDTFTYLKTKNGGTNVQFDYVDIENNNVANNGYTFGAYDYIVYRCQTGRAEAYLTDVSVSGIYTNYSGYVRGGFGMSVWPTGFSVPNKSYNTISSYPDNYVGSNQAQSANTNSGLYNWAWMPSDYYSSGGNSGYLACRWNLFFSQNGFTVDEITFSGVQTSNYGDLFFVIMCPVYGGNMSNSDPSLTTTVSTTTDNSAGTTVVVDVDMTETNSLLGQIKQAILGIVDGITNALKDLFIPDEEFLDDFKEDMLGTDQEPGFLEEHLGGLYQAIEAIGRIFDEFPDAVAATTIDIPACQIPLAGETLTLGPYSVPLIVEGLPQIFYDGLKFIIDFLCVAAFLNMCRNKLEIFLNPDSEVVQNDS